MSNMQDVVRILKDEHTRLSKQLQGITAALAAFGSTYTQAMQNRGRLSAAARARIAAAQRARWARVKASAGKSNVMSMPKTVAKKRTMSVAARKRIAAAQRARWAKVRAGKKSA